MYDDIRRRAFYIFNKNNHFNFEVLTKNLFYQDQNLYYTNFKKMFKLCRIVHINTF